MMLQLNPNLIEDLVGKDLIAFGTGGLGKIVIPYLAQEPDIKIYGVTNSRVTAEDAGTFLDTKLPIRSLDTWKKLMPEATILLCVVRKNEADALAACEAAGYRRIMAVPIYLVEMLQDIYNPMRRPTSHPFLHLACMANEIRETHKASFSEFKGCHRGKTVAVIATGPSLNNYTPVRNVPCIGVNSSFLKEGIHLDYYFLGHYIPEWIEQMKDCTFVKFFERNEWICQNNPRHFFPEYVVEEHRARRYFACEPICEFYTDITSYPLMGMHTIALHALQFAVFTRPKRILLVGCECSYDGQYKHFSDTLQPAPNGDAVFVERTVLTWVKGYKMMRDIIERFYPDTEIISINPVGLKGMFHDMYTESYLDAHPELDRAECEIFDPEKFETDEKSPLPPL